MSDVPEKVRLMFGGGLEVEGSREAVDHLVRWYDALKALSPVAYVLEDLSDKSVVIQINGPGRHRQLIPGPTWGAFLEAQQIVAKQRAGLAALRQEQDDA